MKINKITCTILSIISAILISLSICLHHLFILEFISFIPLFFLIYYSDYKNTLFFSFISGYISLSVILFAITSFNFFIYIAFTLFLTIVFLLLGYAFKLVQTKLPFWAIIYILPTLWLCIELFLTNSFLSLPLNLGLAQYSNLALIQIADIYGIFGVSFLVMLVNVCLFYLIIQIRTNMLRIKYFPLLPPIIIIGSVFLYGLIQLGIVEKNENSLSVALIQGNLNFEELVLRYKTRKFHKISEDRYFNMIMKSAKHNPDFIIVPESGLMGYFLNLPNLKKKYEDLAISTNSTLIFHGKEHQNNNLYSSIFIVSNTGDLIGSSRKFKPIHFAEMAYKHSKTYQPIQTKTANFGAMICFDVCFPLISRNLVNNNADILIASSNDGRFGYSAFIPLHFAYMPFRAVENRKYFLSANNSGISSIINSKGKIIQQTKIYQQDILFGTAFTNTTQTTFCKSGMLNIFIFLGAYIALGIIGAVYDAKIS
ncbi:MAG: hypothetical protein A2Y40_10165 [Candidatus Margulisbacteria bacterium GWF2_35_9]|nr:MAG: hypothetical protein A2Y40_10165 [Candidatus Margulisbacteria bacterium GWF2_35_9]